MRSTMDFFAGHYTARVAGGYDLDRVKDLLDGYRAAERYLRIMRERPWRRWPDVMPYQH